MYTEQEPVDSFMLILGCSSNLFNSFNKEYFCVSRLTTFLKKIPSRICLSLTVFLSFATSKEWPQTMLEKSSLPPLDFVQNTAELARAFMGKPVF